jgi:hypothetical protein
MQRRTIAQDIRAAVRNAVKNRYIAIVERPSRRKRARVISNHHVGPDIEIELFMLTPGDAAEPNDGPTPTTAPPLLGAPNTKHVLVDVRCR